MSNNTATGTLHLIKQAQQVTEKFTKQEFVLLIDPERQKYAAFQVANDKTKLLNGLNNGDELTVHFNFDGRKWVDPNTSEVKYFNTLSAWRIERNGASATPVATADKPVRPAEPAEGDLPF